jgi:putative membrane protein
VADRDSAFSLNGIIVRVVVNAVALAVAWLILRPRIEVADVTSLVIAAVIFGVVNALVKPVVTLLTCPLVILTLGLFTFIINAAMLGLTSWLSEQFAIGFRVDGFLTALVGAVIVTIVSWVLSSFTD